MAGTDSQKHLLTLIRDFAAENSQGERRVVELQKRIQELQSEMDIANAELEESKRFKEAAEQGLKGCEVELSMNDASIQTLEARNSAIQYKISVVGADLEDLKNEEGASRDKFIKQMMELNTKIRSFQETTVSTLHRETCFATSSDDGNKLGNENDAQVALRTLEEELAHLVSQTNTEEQEYQTEQNLHNQLQQELIDIERNVTLMEAVMKETKELEELTRQKMHERKEVLGSFSYFQWDGLLKSPKIPSTPAFFVTSELEETCASLGEKLQNKCICPNCGEDNVETLGGILSAD